MFGAFYALDHGAFFYGGTTTKNERARESFDVASAEIRDVALNGPTEEELDKGKTYLIGSYPLRFDASVKIDAQLVQIQLEGRAPDWLVERNRLIGAVTLADAKRACARAFGDGSLYTTVVGEPEGFWRRAPSKSTGGRPLPRVGGQSPSIRASRKRSARQASVACSSPSTRLARSAGAPSGPLS